MALVIKQGEVSNLTEATITVGRNGNVNSGHSWSFRIGTLPSNFKSASHGNIANGDLITGVGKMKNGSFLIYSYRNETTGAVSKAPAIPQLIFGICFAVLGLLTVIILVGFLLFPLGLYFLYLAYNLNEANSLLKRTPKPIKNQSN
ncbi:MAG: hypothetical protein EOO43_08295 [Flavobacterium sp.]|nr:MAG: hypothetical protein EOO43_08295 [Flavobacterium sp.]